MANVQLISAAFVLSAVLSSLARMSWILFCTWVIRRHPPRDAARLIRACNKVHPFRRPKNHLDFG